MTQLTNAQSRVVEASGREHLLVDAGAGSGKTTTVVQALCHQLGLPVETEGGVIAPPAVPLTFEQVAAITFTNQAAADLKRKLRGALRSAGRTELAAEVDAAQIGTIHGFCGDLLRDFALRARTRPGGHVLTDGEANLLLADHVREALHAAIAQNDVEGLDDLLVGRQLRHVSEWLLKAAGDTDRLARWRRTAGTSHLRPHELALLTIAERANRAHAEQLRQSGELDFDRMIVATRDLLLDAGVRRAVQRRIRLLVVDEFQDVDPAQRDIAELLGGLLHTDDPSPSRLILVGDPKQSIYRFRRADVTVWNGIAARFKAGAGTVVPLDENFRSKSAILGFVDAVIGPLLDSPVDEQAGRHEFEVEYAPVVPKAHGHEGDRAVELLVVPAGPDGKVQRSEDVRAAESVAIAERIVALHAEGRRYRDVAVLLASWSDVERYEGALKAAGVPVYVQRGEGFWEAREVLDSVLALRALRDAADHVAVVGFLKSPFVGLRDETLLSLARARGEGTYVEALEQVEAEPALRARAAGLFARFAPLRDRLPTHELLRRLLFESGYTAAAALDTNGPQRVANLRKLLRIAAAAPDLSLGEFLREVEESRSRAEKVAPERLYGSGGDVVTITSIHSAKGLEWPVVIWADLVRELVPDKDAFIAGRESFAVKELDDEGEDGGKPAKDPVHEAAKRRAELEGRAESYRLWYVATTRAKELCIVSGIPAGEPRKAASPALLLRGRIGDPGALKESEFTYESRHGERFHAPVRMLKAAAPSEERRTPPADESTATLTEPEAPIHAPAGSARLSATQLMTFAHDPARWRRLYVSRFDATEAAKGGRTAARAIAIGQVVHAVLERALDEELDLDFLLEQAIGRWDEDAPDAESDVGRAWRRLLRQRVEAAVNSSVWQEIAGAAGARRELAFTRVLPDGSVINGAFDLAAPIEGGVRVLDVKTGAPASGAELAERYRIQAAVYADAARAIAGAARAEFALLAVPSGDVVEVEPRDDVIALVSALRRSAQPKGISADSMR